MYELAAQEQLTDTDAGTNAGDPAAFQRESGLCEAPFRAVHSQGQSGQICLETAFGNDGRTGILLNFLKLLCDRGILGDYAVIAARQYTRRYNAGPQYCHGSGDKCSCSTVMNRCAGT